MNHIERLAARKAMNFKETLAHYRAVQSAFMADQCTNPDGLAMARCTNELYELSAPSLGGKVVLGKRTTKSHREYSHAVVTKVNGAWAIHSMTSQAESAERQLRELTSPYSPRGSRRSYPASFTPDCVQVLRVHDFRSADELAKEEKAYGYKYDPSKM